jgi:signal transduction histidine kinase
VKHNPVRKLMHGNEHSPEIGRECELVIPNMTHVPSVLAGPAVVAFAYYLTAMLGEFLAFPSAPVSALWAPNAVVFAALLFAPLRQWWLYLLAVLPAHCIAQFPVSPVEQVAIQYVLNCAEAMLGATALLWLEDKPTRFDRLRTMANLIIVGAILAPLVTSAAMAAAFVALGLADDFWLTTIARTITNAFATMTLVPLIAQLVSSSSDAEGAPGRNLWYVATENVLLGVCLIAVGSAVFVAPVTEHAHMPALLYAPIPLLLWVTVRVGIVATCTSMLLIGALATWGVLHGNGPFVAHDPVQNAVSLVLFLIVTSAPLLLLAAVLCERRHATAALLANETLHRSVLTSLQNQIAVLDRNGVVLEINGSWQRAHEARELRAAAAVPGQNYLAASSAGAERGDAACVAMRPALDVVLSGVVARQQSEFVLRGQDGTCWFEQTVEALRRPEGGVVVTLSDISARKRAEHEVQEQQHELARLGRLAVLGEFSGTIAHEIRQPLAAILTNAEAAALELDRERVDLSLVREIVTDIISDDLRAADVIQHLHSMLRNEVMHHTLVRLNDLAVDTLLLIRNELIRRGVVMVVQFQPGLPNITGDRVQIQQVLVNLITNACDAMADLEEGQRQITLMTHTLPQRDEVELVVSDCGGGVEQSKLDRIFQPFVTTKSNGLGLGLSVSKSIVTAHGGRVWVENGCPGAAFHVVFPSSASVEARSVPPPLFSPISSRGYSKH